MAQDSSQGILEVESEGRIRLSDVRKLLAALEDAYNRVLVLLELLDGLPRLQRAGIPPFPAPLVEFEPSGIVIGKAGKPDHFTKSSVASRVGKNQALILSGVRLESPGSWKLLGVSDALEVVRKYLNDRHERRKDKQYREATDEEKRRLENELLRTNVLSQRIKVAKEMGATEGDLAPLLGQLLYDPLDELAVFQDRGLMKDVRMDDPDGPELPGMDVLNLDPKRKIDFS
jgi:hypothetical protein